MPELRSFNHRPWSVSWQGNDWPTTPKGVAEVNGLLQQNIQTVTELSGKVGQLTGSFEGVAQRQARLEESVETITAKVEAVDDKISRLIDRTWGAGLVARVLWMLFIPMCGVLGWFLGHFHYIPGAQ